MRTLKFTRDFFVPMNEPTLRTIQRPDLNAVAYTYESKGVPYALAFKGKANNPAFHYRFPDVKRRTAYIENWFTGITQHEQIKKEHRIIRNKEMDEIRVGDILYHSWGYDQTNIDFYQVVARTPGTITVRELCQDATRTYFDGGHCTPLRNRFVKDSKPELLRSAKYSKWDGRPLHWSDGH